MEKFKRVLKWISHNRFQVIVPIVALMIWFSAVGCAALTPDPLGSNNMLNSRELQNNFALWKVQQEKVALKFEQAAKDIEAQELQWSKIEQMIMKIANGSIADWPGLIQILLASGFAGAVGDNIRKRGLIAGLKRNGY